MAPAETPWQLWYRMSLGFLFPCEKMWDVNWHAWRRTHLVTRQYLKWKLIFSEKIQNGVVRNDSSITFIHHNTEPDMKNRYEAVKNGLKKSASKQHFSLNHIDFDFSRYSLIFDSFLMYSKVKKCFEFEKKIKKKKKCAGGALILFLFFFNFRSFTFQRFWIH